MPYLCDVFGNDLSVIQLSRRFYQLPDKSRSIRAKFVQTVLSDLPKIYGTAISGIWVIPSQFITYSK